MAHNLGLPWRTDDPYPDVINDSNDDEVASVCSNDDCAFIVKAVNAHEAMVEALKDIRLEASKLGNASNAKIFDIATRAMRQGLGGDVGGLPK